MASGSPATEAIAHASIANQQPSELDLLKDRMVNRQTQMTMHKKTIAEARKEVAKTDVQCHAGFNLLQDKKREQMEAFDVLTGCKGKILALKLPHECVGKIVIILATKVSTVKSESTELVSRNPEFRIRDSATWAQSH